MDLLISKVICALFFLFITIVDVKSKYLRLREGSPCIGLFNEYGTCIDFRRCPTYEFQVERSNPHPICSYDGKIPIVCCTDCFLYNMTYGLKVHDEFNRMTGRTGVKHYDKCIQNYNKLDYPCKPIGGPPFAIYHLVGIDSDCVGFGYSVVSPAGGEDAKRSEFPHMALLGYGDDLESAQWLCGGSLISERFILTAAHCRSDPNMGPVKFIGLGMLKRSDPVDLWDIYKVKRFIPHPEYRSPNKYHDIALIEIDKEVNFTKSVLPACLAGIDEVDNDHIKSQDTASATGWGALGHRSRTADVLQKVELQQFSELECAVQYPPKRHLRAGYSHATQMCYGDRTRPRDTCGGDSGGPLQVSSAKGDCLFMVIGVTSYGGACGFAGSAGIYTRVSSYVPWIEDIVWP